MVAYQVLYVLEDLFVFFHSHNRILTTIFIKITEKALGISTPAWYIYCGGRLGWQQFLPIPQAYKFKVDVAAASDV